MLATPLLPPFFHQAHIDKVESPRMEYHIKARLATMWWKRPKKMDGITQRTEVMHRWGATVRKRGEQDKEQMRNLFID